MNYYEYNCARCGGFVGEPMKAYGYAGQWCHCSEPKRPEGNLVSVTTSTTGTIVDKQLTMKEIKKVLARLEKWWDAYNPEINWGTFDFRIENEMKDYHNTLLETQALALEGLKKEVKRKEDKYDHYEWGREQALKQAADHLRAQKITE